MQLSKIIKMVPGPLTLTISIFLLLRFASESQCHGNQNAISNQLLKDITENTSLDVRIIDLRSKYKRERFGFLPGSLLISQSTDLSSFLNTKEFFDYIIVMMDGERGINTIMNLANSSQPVFFHTSSLKDYEGKLEYTDIIEFKALQDALDAEDILLIDVRTRRELVENGKIPGSYSVPIREIRNEGAFELPNDQFNMKYGFAKPRRNDSFVLSCHSGGRSKAAEMILRKNGYTNIRQYLGSFKDWVFNGGKVVKGE